MGNYDAIIVLGGGRYNDGSLTELSKQRLDAGVELYKRGVAPKIFALGGEYSTYRPGAICFPETGAKLRSEYLQKRGVSQKNIILVEDGKDTICEAFASQKMADKLSLSRILIVTSDKHLPRSLFIFEKIFGSKYQIKGYPVPCGDILNLDEENAYLKLVKKYFSSIERELPKLDVDSWEKKHQDYYRQHLIIHNKFHPPGKESQAYTGVRDSGLRPE